MTSTTPAVLSTAPPSPRYSNAIPHRAREMERTVTSEIRSLKKIAMMTATMTG